MQTNGALNAQHQRLQSQILAFEKDGKLAKVSINFRLMNSEGETLFEQTFTQNVSIQGETYSHFVKAMNKGVQSILNDFSESLSQL